MTIDPTAPTSAVERVARRLAARECLGDEARWGETSPVFRDLYRGAAREMIALAQEPGAEPGGGRTALRDRIAEVLYGFTPVPEIPWEEAPASDRRRFERRADAVLAVLPPPTDRAAVLRWAADQYAKLTDQNEAYDREHGDLDEDARLRYEVVRDVATGLRRMADETPAAEAQPESCAHCGQSISRITGTLAAWWVHDPGGNTVCHPGQAASSPRAPAAGPVSYTHLTLPTKA